jgi:osmotically-inducible protein OsmY
MARGKLCGSGVNADRQGIETEKNRCDINGGNAPGSKRSTTLRVRLRSETQAMAPSSSVPCRTARALPEMIQAITALDGAKWRKTVAMKSDTELQHDVMDELEWEPSMDASKIGVAAKDGVVTLTGSVSIYGDKIEAERIAKSVGGVRAVANELEVHIPGKSERNDTDLAAAAVNAVKWHTSIPDDKLQVTVRNGWITLEGEVEWQYQRDAARDAVRFLKGVKGVTNSIRLAAKPKPKDVRARIEAAFRRSAEVDASHVDIETHDGTIVLKGKVSSWSERTEAERVAWTAPGVTAVDNRLTVEA